MNDFIITKEYKRFSEFCKACQKEKYIGLCYGPAGVGKSMSALHFAEWHKVYQQIKSALIFSVNDITDPIDMTPYNTIVYTPGVMNSPKSISGDIFRLRYTFNELKQRTLYGKDVPGDKRCENHVDILIIDEADRLQPKSLEQIRSIYDDEFGFYEKSQIAVILIGMPGLEKRLVRFPQLYSRIGFAHAFKPLSEEEVRFIIHNHCESLDVAVDINDFTDQEAIAAIIRITQGNFRLVNRLLKQALRIMQINQLSSISKEVIEAARECLVIGNVY